MKAVIMQSTYLPWLGYFSLIILSDVFVFLDNVQFEKQTWQQRNKIRTDKGLEWITLPVLIKGRFGQKILDAEIKDELFYDKHIKQIQFAYSKAKYYNKYADEFFDLLKKVSITKNVSIVNQTLIKWFCEKLSIKKELLNSSELKAAGKRSELLVNILNEINADAYISPIGSLEYIKADFKYFKNIAVYFHNFEHPEYTQVYSPFMPYASIIDLLFNEGERSLDIIRSGQKRIIPIKELM